MVATIILSFVIPACRNHNNGSKKVSKATAVKPMDLKSIIDSSLTELVSKGKPGEGFVIFAIVGTDKYIQYALDGNGLTLWFPKTAFFSQEQHDEYQKLLISLDFELQQPENTPITEIILNLKEKQFTLADDGIYAQCGNNVNNISLLTFAFIEKVLWVEKPFEIKVSLQLKV